MYIVHVFIHIKPEFKSEFIQATIQNATNSVNEPGIVRFDFIQEQDDPSRFVLVEIYRTPDDPAKHKETDHYNQWRMAVEKMLAEPRSSLKYRNIYPSEDGWE